MIMDSRRFLDEFQRVVRSFGWPGSILPIAALEAWEFVVDECIAGYDDFLVEYSNDLAVRDLLNEVLADPQIRSLSECVWFSESVHRIDAKFRNLIQGGPILWPNEDRWWRRSIPPYGREDFVSDVRERRAVELETVP
jgi:hypothetical protein